MTPGYNHEMLATQIIDTVERARVVTAVDGIAQHHRILSEQAAANPVQQASRQEERVLTCCCMWLRDMKASRCGQCPQHGSDDGLLLCGLHKEPS